MSATPPRILAYQRALHSLARLHYDEMADLYAIERIRLGLPGEANKGRHGTWSKYASGGCRCARCRDASSRFNKQRMAAGLPEGDHRHGTRTGYSNHGCRCEDCCEAGREYQRRYNARKKAVPA